MPRVSCTLVATLVATATLGLASPGAAAPPGPGTVVVRRGDTLSEIAARAGVSTAALASANGLTNPDHLVAGRELVVPSVPSTTHVVRLGETLSTIARHYGVATAALVDANRIRNPNLIVVGSRLRVPGGAGAAGGADLPAPLRADPARLALGPVFDHWAAAYRVPGDLAKALAWMESGWQNRVVSPVGARGIGQLMPDTVVVARRLAASSSLDPAVPEDNIRMTVRFLRYLLDRTGDPATAVAAYYQGLAGIARDGVQPATAHYVEAVLALRARFD